MNDEGYWNYYNQEPHSFTGDREHCYGCSVVWAWHNMNQAIDERSMRRERAMRERTVMDSTPVALTESYKTYLRSDKRFAMWQSEARGESAPHQQEVS